MIPWKLSSSTLTPDTKSEQKLYRRDTEYFIRFNGMELMNSRMFSSEKMLAELSCFEIVNRKKPCVLIGEPGMEYTLSSALRSDVRVILSKLVSSVVEWNRDILGTFTDYPLEDSRVTVLIEDVVHIIKRGKSAFDAIFMDIDNGPNVIKQTTHKTVRENSVTSMGC